jgi:hypothetical protein
MAWRQKLHVQEVHLPARSRQEQAASPLRTIRISLRLQPTRITHIPHNGRLVAILRGDQGTPAAHLSASFHQTPGLGRSSAYTSSRMLIDTATTGAHRPRHWFLPSRRPLRLPSPNHLPWLHPQQPQAQPHQVKRSKEKTVYTTTDMTLTCWIRLFSPLAQ